MVMATLYVYGLGGWYVLLSLLVHWRILTLDRLPRERPDLLYKSTM